MILTTHMLAGAAVASKFDDVGLVFIVALSSHYVLDMIPHWEPYFREDNPADGLTNLRTPAVLRTVLRIALDFSVGLSLAGTLGYARGIPWIPLFIGTLAATAPDFLSFLHFRGGQTSKFLQAHTKFNNTIHFATNKYRSPAVRFTMTFVVSAAAIAVLLL